MTKRHIYAVAKRAGDVVDRVVPFTLSTSDEDRAGDTVDQSGWKLDAFLQNPVVLWSHNHSTPPIGRCVSIGLEGGDLVGRVQFATAEQYAFADTIFQLVQAGIISAGSVGFIPLRFEINDAGGIDFKEQELIEFSIVGVPMNPAALRRAYDLGLEPEAVCRAFGHEPGEHPRTGMAQELEAAKFRSALLAAARCKKFDARKRQTVVNLNRFSLT